MGTSVRTVEISAGAEFGQVETARRRVSGMVVEWGVVASTGGRRYRFARDSLVWSSVSKIKLNRGHDRLQAVGVAERLVSTSRGLMGEFKIARTPEGDETLTLAEDRIVDGFSIEADELDTEPDPEDRRVLLVRRGRLTGVALTGWPAFDEARVDRVAAQSDRLEVRMDSDLLTRLRQHAEADGTTVSETAREGIRRFTTTPRPVYPLTGGGPSFVADAWADAHPHESPDPVGARDRLAANRRFEQELVARFATVDTTSAAEVVPPGYEPLVGDVTGDRPLFDACAHSPVPNASAAFTVPGALTDTDVDAATGERAEGSPPVEGTLDFTPLTVTPTAITGKYTLTRELVESSNPAADTIAMGVLRESFDRQAEAKIAAALSAASGAQVYTAGAGPADVETAALAFPGIRRRRPASIVVDASVAADVADLDMTRVAFRGLSFAISPDIGHAAAADPAVYLLDDRGAARTFTSPLLQFRSFEQAGPEKIIVALWGYFAVAVITPRGLAAIQWAS